jgi:chemotaxis protein histidine kinase CheA
MAIPPENTPLGESISEIIDRTTTIVHEEIELAKAEMSVALQDLLRGSVAGIVGGVFAFFGLFILLIAISFLVADAIGTWYPWLGFFIVAFICFALGGLLAFVALKKIKKGSQLAPSQAISEAKTTKEALQAEQGKPIETIDSVAVEESPVEVAAPKPEERTVAADPEVVEAKQDLKEAREDADELELDAKELKKRAKQEAKEAKEAEKAAKAAEKEQAKAEAIAAKAAEKAEQEAAKARAQAEKDAAKAAKAAQKAQKKTKKGEGESASEDTPPQAPPAAQAKPYVAPTPPTSAPQQPPAPPSQTPPRPQPPAPPSDTSPPTDPTGEN